MRIFALPMLMLLFVSAAAVAIEEADYPHPVIAFTFDSQQQTLAMKYMDVQPEGKSKGVVMLLHGKNFTGAYWHQTIDFLVGEGYRVVVPDQVGFGLSTLPEHYQFTFAQLAANSKALLEHLDIDKVTVMGHSMGGMLATRFALQYPDDVRQLLLLNPIGLEDWRAMGVPYVSIDKLYNSERNKNFGDIKIYQQASYYDSRWNNDYARWAQLLADSYQGDQGDRFAWNMALTSDMVMSQPVVYEFDQLKVPTTLLIGTRDRTAIGRNLVDDETAQKMGDYTQLGKTAAKRIPDAHLIEFDDVGHLPHIEAPERYLKALKTALNHAQ
ncbi:MAG TPA: alpha/beta hydrolase [Methylophaga sp.]|nr:alpha/beta hydrolase [Methylophaga sp.]